MFPSTDIHPIDLERAYWRKVQSVQRNNLIGFWPLWERSGSVARDLSPQANNGAYTIGTLAGANFTDGRGMPTFDGATDYVDLYSASLVADFDGGEGSLLVWAKVSAVGVWTDGAERWLVGLSADNNNRIRLYRATTNNRLAFNYAAGGTNEFVTMNGLSETGLMVLGLTWSKTAGQVKAFYGASQEGTTQTGLGTWSGSLAETKTVIGANATTPGAVWSGNLARFALWNTPLSNAMMAWLSKAP